MNAPLLMIDEHPLLDAVVFETEFSQSIGELPKYSREALVLMADAPLQSSDEVRKIVRDLLRHGGFKPTGRSKPASEYLLKAVEKKLLSPINFAVDALNLVSMHSGLPISVIDLDLAEPPFRIGIAPDETSFVFNATGQTIKLDGLLCLFDQRGPCANAVKDCQRTKTHDGTRKTLSVIWGTKALPGRAEQTFDWYRSLLEQEGSVSRVKC